MVDVGAKAVTERVAVAATVLMRPETLSSSAQEGAKGDVLAVARLAGIMAAKKTPELIPLCHPLALTSVSVTCARRGAQGRRHHRHLQAEGPHRGRDGSPDCRSVAALTIYDMCKAVDRAMVIADVRLLRKSGGKSGNEERRA